MFSKFALVAVLPLFLQIASAQSCTRNYTVQEGDTCDSISAAQNVSTYQFASVNSGIVDSSCSNLQPGANICLGYEGEDCTTTYTVAAQDTCDSISSAYSINSTLLYNNNPQIDSACDNIYVGEVLCVASTIAAPPVGSSSVNTAIPSTATAAAFATPTTSSTVTPPPATTSTVDSSPVASSTITSAAAASSSSSGDDDDDDSDLPYCDEL
ncbi:hypothetical protein EV361DRAFT_923388 [Lentinula raphanica]|uniref:LysM domain-containing protein n=1 Tax=Lentinula raphanica TaxID=153919 RepID=A0AA38PKL9_9AGAR|nr:hypothetical protein C8R42DRAFT_692471 [Lentinula raphanica]KAJ3751699.1 hypothetical protein EV360DRAFT_75997 [Lentinula raphanica]KAJ3765538.1 hypothetical protein FB446DRAFT_850098 [Lentinula raphanica]KAJ3826394.1 hypothetical protein F5880DRAFT_1545210 [Lentinula raphanica]KAJ3844393.1 hypothetical protein F5878DRAFT_602093 [Lentinula raphanica]